jgi:hypothetical protein
VRALHPARSAASAATKTGYHRDRCARCVLASRLTGLLGDGPARTAQGLQPLYVALLAAERPEAVIGWLRPYRPGHTILARLASGELELSHAALDAVDDVHRNATGHLGALLTALGALPQRDTHLALLERDLTTIVGGAADPELGRVLRRYATWGLLRHARAKASQTPLSSGVRHGLAASLKTAVHFTGWLAERGMSLPSCRQPDLDAYLLAHPARREELRHFLAWARRNRDPALTISPSPRPSTVIPLGQHQRWKLARTLLHEDGYDPGDRVAGLLVLLFGQRPGKIVRLTTDDIGTDDGGHTTLALGATPIRVPEPLASHLHQLARHRRALTQIPAGDPGPWLFPASTRAAPSCPPPSATALPHRHRHRHRPRGRPAATCRRTTAHGRG